MHKLFVLLQNSRLFKIDLLKLLENRIVRRFLQRSYEVGLSMLSLFWNFFQNSQLATLVAMVRRLQRTYPDVQFTQLNYGKPESFA